MKLFVSETKVQDASIPIRWCLNQKELEELKMRKVKNPHLLLVTVHDKQEVDRYLIPLDQMLAYIQFHKPGENRILATVVWCEDSEINQPTSKLRHWFLQRSSSGGYEQNILKDDGENFLLNLGYFRLKQQVELIVVVPAELFAKEPPAWEKWWVNLWHETKKPRDQCQYRRRRMLAYSIQPLVVLLFMIVISIFRALAAAVLLFLGKRGVDLKPIIHPFQYQSEDVWGDTEDSVFLRNAKGKRQHWLISFFSPLVFLIFLAILVGIRFIFPSLVSNLTLRWWHYPLGTLAVMVGIVVVAYALFAFLFIVDFLSRLILKPVEKPWSEQRKVRRERTRKKEEEKELEEAEKRRRKEEQLRAELEQLLACDGEFVPRLSALPKEKQTIYLRFQDLKAKVCKPYAR